VASQTKKKKRVGVAALPSAPLAEVVFELRWQLQPGPLPYDPMLIPLLHQFSEAMSAAGYPHSVDLSVPMQTGPYGVLRRYMKTADSAFPLMQVGPGIFAANESAAYVWRTYKAQVIAGLKALFASYPSNFGFSILPVHLELRYVDAFDKATVGTSELFRFIESGTCLDFKFPSVLDKREFWADTTGRLFLQRNVRGEKETIFTMDLASAHRTETKQNIIQLISRVLTVGVGIPRRKSSDAFIKDVSEWLEMAHGLTSPFFKEFISPSILEKFKRV
jgi:uncharacterized protein (TIGR04255 family)